MSSSVSVEFDGSIATVTINRPDALNALSVDILDELKTVFQTLAHRSDGDAGSLRGVILTGAGGRAFVAGADIRAMSGMDAAGGYAIGQLGQLVTTAIEALPVPVIAAVDGFALGGGCELALACDVILATEQSRFGQPEVKLGLMTGFGGSIRLPRLVGAQRAKDLLYSGRIIDAETAAHYGLVLEVAADRNALMSRATELLQEYAGNSPAGIAATKRVLDETAGASTAEGLARELQAFAERFGSDDMLEGTRAFLEKRSPRFGPS